MKGRDWENKIIGWVQQNERDGAYLSSSKVIIRRR